MYAVFQRIHCNILNMLQKTIFLFDAIHQRGHLFIRFLMIKSATVKVKKSHLRSSIFQASKRLTKCEADCSEQHCWLFK